MPTLNYDESVKDIIYDDTDWESEVYGLIDTDTYVVVVVLLWSRSTQ